MTTTKKSPPNILFIMADDIGWFNPSCYHGGVMGYETPNIDRIAKEGARFTDFYGQQSCTAGRAAFITGQSPIRTGLTKVGMPGATLGLSFEDPSVGQFLKNFGYATGQFGKNHLGDRNEHLPTVHGFDEFFGNLYHLNAEEEPYYENYPKDPAYREKYGPRGVLKCKATDKDDATEDKHFGKVGKQTIENTGPLPKERMETVDEEFLAAALDFIDRKHKEGAPWFCYFNPTRMHVWTHLKPASRGKTGLGLYPDGMVELDGYVGQLLKKIDDLGLTDNTIVVFTTDNGAEVMTWPDGGCTPFRGEKDTNWEGGWRVPCVMRWPGVIQPGRLINDICSLQDFIPTFAAANGETDLVEKVKEGYKIGDKTYKVHLDGFNLIPFLSGKEKESPRTWVEANGRVEKDALGKPVRFPGVLLGHDERHRVEAERDRALALLRTFTETVPGVVYAKDREGRLVVGNHGVADLLGVPQSHFLGRTDLELLADKAQAEAVMANDRRIMESGVAEQVEEEIQFADGSPAIWLSTKAPWLDEDGNVVGLIGASVDITERRRLIETLEQADRRKDEFLAMLSHELRNPLAPIRTAAELLRLAPGDEARVSKSAQIISRQVAHMTELVDDLLDVSRVTRGLVDFDRKPVDMRAVVAAAVEQAEPTVQLRRHTLAVETSGGPAFVLGDWHRLVQVVTNLLNNAAKYTSQAGSIRIALTVTGGEVAVEVTDNGIGIDPSLLPHVFDLFTQAARTPDRAQGGLGIGLALVRSIVRAHGGTITASSGGLARGSTFRLVLPRTEVDLDPVAEPKTSRVPVTARTVMLVDDNRDAADTLATVLRLLGHDVTIAADGHEALGLLALRPRWDVFILDIGMPDMTGHELARRLRERMGDQSARFIALTGYGQEHDEAESRAAGFHHHVVKPVDIDRVAALLAIETRADGGAQHSGVRNAAVRQSHELIDGEREPGSGRQQ